MTELRTAVEQHLAILKAEILEVQATIRVLDARLDVLSEQRRKIEKLLDLHPENQTNKEGE